MASRTGWQALNFSVLLHNASRYSARTFKMVKTCCVYMFGCASCSAGKEKGLSFHRFRRTDVDMFCKDCQVVQDECEGVPWKTEQKKREDKDEKKKGHEEPNENLSDEKWRSDEKKLKTWLVRMQNSHGKVKSNARVRGKASKVDDEAVLHTCIPTIFPWTKSATPRNPPEERRRQLAVALLRNTGEKPRARSASTRLPFFQVVDRQDGADGCAMSDTGPVETAADHQRSENWSRCGESGSESSSAAEVGGFSMARKRRKIGNELVSEDTEMAKIFPPCATKMFPPKPLPPSAFRFVRARWRIRKCPIRRNFHQWWSNYRGWLVPNLSAIRQGPRGKKEPFTTGSGNASKSKFPFELTWDNR